jgi:hypothetical protein
MALTPEEKKRVLDMLEQADDYEKKRALASSESFGTWLYNKAYSIYCKVKNALSSLWAWLRDLF